MPQVNVEKPSSNNVQQNNSSNYIKKGITNNNKQITNSNNIQQKNNTITNQQGRQHVDAAKAYHHSSGSSRREISGSSNVVGGHFKVGRRIGEGSFGIIYEGLNTLTNQHVAIKYESRKSEAPQLRDEYRSYKLLSGFPGIPNAYYFGTENIYNILVVDLLGPSLEDLFDTCHRKFSVKTVCLAAKQMLCRVQSVHEKSLVYRDIKPDNFLVGRIPPYVDTSSDTSHDGKTKNINSILENHSKDNPHPASKIYLIDFGMAKFYRDPKTLQHIPYKEKRSLSGTARYMSINTHLGREQSRRDDLEGLGHVLMYFLRGSLPWQGMKAATNKQKYEKIGEKKRITTIKELCDGFPEEFSIYMNYVRKLGFEETPDYDYLRGLFDKVLKKIGVEDDGVFDWMVEMEEQRKEITRLREKQRNSSSNTPKNLPNLALNDLKVNSNNVQNSSMQVLSGRGTCSLDEVAIAKSSNPNVNESNGNIVKNSKNEINDIGNSPLNQEIKPNNNIDDETDNDNLVNNESEKKETSKNNTLEKPTTENKASTNSNSKDNVIQEPKTAVATNEENKINVNTEKETPENEEKKKNSIKKKNKKFFNLFSCCKHSSDE